MCLALFLEQLSVPWSVSGKCNLLVSAVAWLQWHFLLFFSRVWSVGFPPEAGLQAVSRIQKRLNSVVEMSVGAGVHFKGSRALPRVCWGTPWGLWPQSASRLLEHVALAGAQRGWDCGCKHKAWDLAGTDSSCQVRGTESPGKASATDQRMVEYGWVAAGSSDQAKMSCSLACKAFCEQTPSPAVVPIPLSQANSPFPSTSACACYLCLCCPFLAAHFRKLKNRLFLHKIHDLFRDASFVTSDLIVL